MEGEYWSKRGEGEKEGYTERLIQSTMVPTLQSYHPSQGCLQPQGMMVTCLSKHVEAMATQQEIFQVSIDSKIITYKEVPENNNKKPRLHWSQELHARFVDAVNKLGGASKATPKTIQTEMGTEGLTLPHIKSHLQKFRLGKPMGRLWKKSKKRRERASRKTKDLKLQQSHGFCWKSAMASGVYKQGSDGQIHYEKYQLQQDKRKKALENNQSWLHHENTSYTFKAYYNVEPVAALPHPQPQPTSALQNHGYKFGDYQFTRLPLISEATKVQVRDDERRLPPLSTSSPEEYYSKVLEHSNQFAYEEFPRIWRRHHHGW